MDRLFATKSVFRVLCALLALCAGSWIVMGQAIFTDYKGAFKPAGIVDPGTVECPGGQPTGAWPFGAPCSPLESRVRVRGMVKTYLQESTDPRVRGTLFVEINANFDGWPGTGPMWGTGRLEVSPGEVWQGSWTGERTPTGENLSSITHGSGGSIEGFKKFEEASKGTSQLWSVSGRILNPGGK